jgi:hypothetical protein
VALCLNKLGSQHLLMHDPQAATAALNEALAIGQRDGLLTTQGFILSNLADAAPLQGDLDAAARHAERGLEPSCCIASWPRDRPLRTARAHRARVIPRRRPGMSAPTGRA